MKYDKQTIEKINNEMLLAVYELSRRNLHVTPTMVSVRMGYDLCARTVPIRKRLEAAGLLKQIQNNGNTSLRVLLKLTPAGLVRARQLAPTNRPVAQRSHYTPWQHDGAPFLPADVPPLLAKANPAGRKITQKSNVTVSIKDFNDAYKGRRYEDADLRLDDRGGPKPSKSYNRSLTGYSGDAG